MKALLYIVYAMLVIAITTRCSAEADSSGGSYRSWGGGGNYSSGGGTWHK